MNLFQAVKDPEAPTSKPIAISRQINLAALESWAELSLGRIERLKRTGPAMGSLLQDC